MSVSARIWADGSTQAVFRWSGKEVAGSSSRPLRMAGGAWASRRCESHSSRWSEEIHVHICCFAVLAFEFESVIVSHSEVCDFVVSIRCYGRRWFLDTTVTMIPSTSALRIPIAAVCCPCNLDIQRITSVPIAEVVAGAVVPRSFPNPAFHCLGGCSSISGWASVSDLSSTTAYITSFPLPCRHLPTTFSQLSPKQAQAATQP